MKALVRFEPTHNEKNIRFSVGASQPTELSMLTSNIKKNSQACLLTMPPKCLQISKCKHGLAITNEP